MRQYRQIEKQDYSVLFEGMTARYPSGLIHQVQTEDGTVCSMKYGNLEIRGPRPDLESFKRELQSVGLWNPIPDRPFRK